MTLVVHIIAGIGDLLAAVLAALLVRVGELRTESVYEMGRP